jgi:hypothetical protein
MSGLWLSISALLELPAGKSDGLRSIGQKDPLRLLGTGIQGIQARLVGFAENLSQKRVPNLGLVDAFLHFFQLLQRFGLLNHVLKVAQVANGHNLLAFFIFNYGQVRRGQDRPDPLIKPFSIFQVAVSKLGMEPFSGETASETLDIELCVSLGISFRDLENQLFDIIDNIGV